MTVMNQLMMGASGPLSDCTALEGKLWMWGDGDNYLGHGNLTSYSSPEQIGSLTTWTNNMGDVSNSATRLVIKSDGTLWGWGENSNGSVGKGAGNHTQIKYESPVQIGSSTDWARVSTGGGHSAAIKTNGALYTWGNNNYGQLGQGNTTETDEPNQVGSGTNWAFISCAEAYYTMAMKTDGTLWGCGSNRKGNLGIGNTNESVTTFTQVGSATHWLAFMVIARTTNGQVIALSS